MADVSRHHPPEAGTAGHPAESGMAGHPDIVEMRERYAKVIGGRRAVATEDLVVLAGLYLAISPWVVHFHTTNPDIGINNLILGLAVAAIGIALGMVPERMSGMGITLGVIGLWTIISPWVVGSYGTSGGVIANNVVIGALVLLFGLATMALIHTRGGAGERR